MDEHTPTPAELAWQSALDWHLRLSEAAPDSPLHQACQQWQAAAPEHARAWRKLQRVWGLTGEAMTQTVPLAIQPSTPRVRSRRWPRRLLGGAIAACLCLALLHSQQPFADYSSPVGGSRELTLADGSRVTLDSDSAIDSDLSGGQRKVTLLRGRAYFAVQPDASRPFIVTAGSSQVRVTGTAFTVERETGRLDVSVEHGSVQVSDTQLSSPAALTPGEHLRLSNTGPPQRDQQPTNQMAAWRKGLLIANATPVEELLTVIGRYQRGLILLQDKTLARQTVTGVFDLHTPQQALQALTASLDAEVRHYGPFLTLITRTQ